MTNWPILSICILLACEVNSELYSDSLRPKVWECGRQGDGKSLGGQLATPWTVGIFTKDNQVYQDWKYIQAGTLVGLQTIITCGSLKINSDSKVKLSVRSGVNGSYFEVTRVKVLESGEPSLLLVPSQWEPVSRNLYLLHLKYPIPISMSSRPICLDPSLDIFEHKNEYSGSRRNRSSQNHIYLTGYTTMGTNENNLIRTVQISPPKRWRIYSWRAELVVLLETSVTLFGFNLQQHENPYLPRLFDPGSALVYRKGESWFLLGVSLKSENHSRTQIRSVEKGTRAMFIKQQCASHQTCSDGYCVPATCDERVICECSCEDYIRNCGDSCVAPNQGMCQSVRANSSFTSGNISFQSSGVDTNSNIKVTTVGPLTNQKTHEGYSEGNSTKIYNISGNVESATVTNDNAMEMTVKCPPINLGPSSQNIDLSCRFQNGSRAGLLCSEQLVEIGSTAILTCIVSDRNMKKICTAMGTWEPPTNLKCVAQSVLQIPQEELVLQSKPKDKDAPKVAEVVTCPSIELLEGVEISCSGSLNGTGDDCIKEALPNTVTMLKCKPFYTPLKDTTLNKICDSSGTWLPRKPFGCTIDCGVTDISKLPFIVHGSKTQSEVWPWHAALFLSVNGINEYLCGATLISRSILVTAAHCVERATRGSKFLSNYKVAVGAISSNYIVNLKDEQTQMFDIANVTINPHYNNRSYEGDIALIRLSKSATLSEFVTLTIIRSPSQKIPSRGF